jgi:hypothetical protein
MTFEGQAHSKPARVPGTKPKNITDDIFLAQILGHKLLGPNSTFPISKRQSHHVWWLQKPGGRPLFQAHVYQWRIPSGQRVIGEMRLPATNRAHNVQAQ